MRPIRKYGANGVISDRLSIRNLEKINTNITLPPRQSLTSSIFNSYDDRRKYNPNGLFFTNNYVIEQSEKENRRVPTDATVSNGENGKLEIIINTPSFQLICDRRRTQARHASADEACALSPIRYEKQLKSVLKKSDQSSPPLSHRSRWSSFNRRTVSFADDKGLQLAEIKMIEQSEMDYLDSVSFPLLNRHQASGFIPDFILPPPYRRLRRLHEAELNGHPPLSSSLIVLESYNASRWNMTGVIAIRKSQSGSMDCEKRVLVRCTGDRWTTHVDVEATPAVGMENGMKLDPLIERYSFTVPFPPRAPVGARFEFKLGVRMGSIAGAGSNLPPVTYWDDNNGSNYGFSFV